MRLLGGTRLALPNIESVDPNSDNRRRTAMLKRALSIGVMAISVAASAAMAGSLTERLESERMTVIKVDPAAGRFLCAEHRHWTSVAKNDLATVLPGDVVRTERVPNRPT